MEANVIISIPPMEDRVQMLQNGDGCTAVLDSYLILNLANTRAIKK